MPVSPPPSLFFENTSSNLHFEQDTNKNNKSKFSFIVFRLNGACLPRGHPDCGTYNPQLFLFKDVADWDINLGRASTAPVPWVRYSDALGSR